MKKLLFFAICCLFVSGPSMAQDSERPKEKIVKGFLHAILYLKDGTIAEGYLQNITPGVYVHYRIPDAVDSMMILRPDNKLFTKKRKYSNNEIDSMATWLDEEPETRVKWEPQFVNFTFGNKVIELDTYPSMLCLVYQGKHVKGYISSHQLYGFKYLFKIDDMPCAKAFLRYPQKFSEKRRKTLFDTFYMYPEMEEYIKGLTKEDVKADPCCILKHLDSILSTNDK